MINADLSVELKDAGDDEIYHVINPNIIKCLHNYVFHKLQPGGFVTAVLSNDLREAVGRADGHNVNTLKEILTYCYMQIPSACWGSPESVVNWLKKGEVG
jgi:hypothetical protein